MRIKAIVIACFLAIGVCLGSAGCGGKEPVKAAAEKPVVLKAVTNNPKNSGHYRGLEIYKKLVEERTGGRVLVELYSDGVMGDEEEMAEGMKSGTVDVMMAAAAKYANFVPEMDLYSPPYTFKNWAHMKAVTFGEIDAKIARAVKERRGEIYLGPFTDGTRNIFTNKPIRSLDDMRGLKLRIMTGPNENNAWHALFTNPTPTAYTELYAALKAGVIDGAENTFTSLLGMKFFESCKYVLRTEHSFMVLCFLMSAKAYQKVPADLRDIVVQAGKDTCRLQVDIAIIYDKENEEVLKRDHGITVFEFSKADFARAQELVKSIQDENARRIGMVAELNKIRELAKQY